MNGINLLQLPAQDACAYGRVLLFTKEQGRVLLFTKEQGRVLLFIKEQGRVLLFTKEQGRSVVLRTAKSSKPPLPPDIIQLLIGFSNVITSNLHIIRVFCTCNPSTHTNSDTHCAVFNTVMQFVS